MTTVLVLAAARLPAAVFFTAAFFGALLTLLVFREENGLVEAQGYAKGVDTFTYNIDPDFETPRVMQRLVERVAAEVTVDGQRVARAEMTFMLRDVDAPALHEQRRQLYRLWTRDLQPPVPIP